MMRTTLWSLIPNPQVLPGLDPDQLAHALMTCLRSSTEDSFNLYNLGLEKAFTSGYPEEFRALVDKVVSGAWSLLLGRGYLGQKPGAHDSSFVVITPQGERWHSGIHYGDYGGISETKPQPPTEQTSKFEPTSDYAPNSEDTSVSEEVPASEFVSSQSESSSESSDPRAVESLMYTDRCQRLLTSGAGYSRNRKRPQDSSLTTTGVLFAAIDLGLQGIADPDDAVHVFGDAIREIGLSQYQERRRTYLREDVPVTVFDHEPLTLAFANVSANTHTLLLEAADIARNTDRNANAASYQEIVDSRHLVAALLTAFPKGRQRSGQAQVLSDLKLSVDVLKSALMEFVTAHFSSSDDFEQWALILGQTFAMQENVPEPAVRKVFEPWIAGYVSDVVRREDDALGIDVDVQTLCSVILARDVSPPLSIGLFGDWGTGKSFFMERMRAEVELATEPSAERSSSKFHTNVAQITFNAWHYVDANLWASLVNHILESLVKHISPTPDDLVVRQKLLGELQTAKELKAEAMEEKSRAENERATIEKQLKDLAKLRTAKQTQLSSLRTEDIWKAVKDDVELKKSLEEALDNLGLPSFLAGFADLDAIALSAGSLGNRVYAIGLSLLRDKRKFSLLTLIIASLVGVPILAWFLGKWLPAQPWVTTISSIGAGFATIAAAFAASLRKPIAKVNTYLKKLEAARNKAFEILNAKRNEKSEAEITIAGELESIKVTEATAALQLGAAEVQVRSVEAKIREIDEGRNLAKFILARSEAGDYRKHLGLISTIRQDFENLSKLLQIAGSETQQPSTVERIILYIDDLDRCSSDRVVDILEAIHLLLAFDLFVVVVGVDPRWLMHSLEERFSAFSEGHVQNHAEDQAWITTPQDYLEKIFQIPFALRKMSPTGFATLIKGLLPVTAAAPGPASEQSIEGEAMTTSQSNSAQAKPQSSPATPMNYLPTPQGLNSNPVGIPTKAVRQLNQESLTIRTWEVDYATLMSSFITTPRGAKRFANIYRLIKAPLSPEDLVAFEGTAASQGEFRAAMLLLAILTGFPQLSARLFRALDGQQTPPITPQQIFANVREYLPESSLTTQLQDCLNRLGPTDVSLTRQTYLKWIPKVARFSFYTAEVSEATT
jgi:KAP family P-loop domain